MAAVCCHLFPKLSPAQDSSTHIQDVWHKVWTLAKKKKKKMKTPCPCVFIQMGRKFFCQALRLPLSEMFSLFTSSRDNTLKCRKMCPKTSLMPDAALCAHVHAVLQLHTTYYQGFVGLYFHFTCKGVSQLMTHP